MSFFETTEVGLPRDPSPNNLVHFNHSFIYPIHREKEPIIYDGDLMDEEGVLDFLTSLEAMDLPDRIEEVNAKVLMKIVEDTDYVAVLFCEYSVDLYSQLSIFVSALILFCLLFKSFDLNSFLNVFNNEGHIIIHHQSVTYNHNIHLNILSHQRSLKKYIIYKFLFKF